MKNIAVIGLGKVGSLVGTLLNESFTVTGIDVNKPATDVPFNVTSANIFGKVEVVDACFVSCLCNGQVKVVGQTGNDCILFGEYVFKCCGVVDVCIGNIEGHIGGRLVDVDAGNGKRFIEKGTYEGAYFAEADDSYVLHE